MLRLLHIACGFTLITVAGLLVLAPVGCGVIAADHGDTPAAGDAPDTGSRASESPRRTVAEVRPVAGVALNCHHISDLSLYLKSVDRIAELGANALLVVTPMFQQRADSNIMRIEPAKCPTRNQLIAILNRAESLGLHTTLLPIVLIEQPGDDDWRGTIRPQDWDSWWASYRDFLDYYLDIANRAEVDLFSIGSELNTTEPQIDRWRSVIEHVRSAFDGQITYSANWDRYRKVELWPLLDVIAVSSYFEIGRQLDDQTTPTTANLAEAWRKPQRELLEFASRHDRPLILSEVGYPSVPWAARHPWNYVVEDGATADHAAQLMCWQAFVRAWADVFASPDNPAAGFFAYAWDPYHHGQPSDTGYGIHGKPAEPVIRRAFRQLQSD